MSRPDRIIPVIKLPEGLRLCAQNVRDFVNEAHLILSKGHGWHAIALAIFAFEELGKYSELKRLGGEAQENGLKEVKVKDELFRSYDTKQNIAKQLVPKQARTLLQGAFGSRNFDSRAFQTETVSVEPNLRLECVFVDWLGDDWRLGAPHDTTRITMFLNPIVEALNKLEKLPLKSHS